MTLEHFNYKTPSAFKLWFNYFFLYWNVIIYLVPFYSEGNSNIKINLRFCWKRKSFHKTRLDFLIGDEAGCPQFSNIPKCHFKNLNLSYYWNTLKISVLFCRGYINRKVCQKWHTLYKKLIFFYWIVNLVCQKNR